jgi:CHAT domain-containing protein
VIADGPPQVIDLSLFRSGSDRSIQRHSTALTRAMDFIGPDETAVTKPNAGQAWRQALDELCDWAWPAVIEPVLRQARQWSSGRLPRLVLVPVGPLSQVPWHAARHRENEGGRFRYACAEAVFSYAASGRQLIDVAQRPARELAESPVIVGNSADDLRHAGTEAQAIRDRCYPAGRYLGPATSSGVRPPDGDGTPAEVLELLPAATTPGASLVHLAGHAFTSASAPGQSFLELAGADKLLVETVLRRANGRPATAPGGLVVMAACGSDLTATGPDEALTLATAFLAAGAVNVVGTRWKILDGPAAPMMFMFHRYLTAGGLAPRDALRAAHLWMLDPDRVAPDDMPASMAGRARRPILAEPIVWAALTHQGR